jgi:hydroxyethylthiazole kinase-like uncharacterized protein yjeF
MESSFDRSLLKKLYIPSSSSHKGMNGKLMIIGGSHLFHAAFLWALKIASRIVDMVFYSSVEENNEIVQHLKESFQDGIVVPRSDIEKYIEEADCVLIGPGLPRKEGALASDDDTQELTKRLLTKYPQKKWVIDGGSLQVIHPSILPKGSVVTPHTREFVKLFGVQANEQTVKEMAEKYDIIIVAKSEKDIVCSKQQCIVIEGGNAGMTKGGTGDVLAGLIAALGCNNDLWLAAVAGSYFNKKAAESLYERVGLYFNASDLADEIPKVMKTEILG